MQNNPTKHREVAGEKDRNQRSIKVNDRRRRGTLARFMLNSDIKPLMFVGKCVQYFGWGAVAGFLLGGVTVYAYAVLKPLPYAKSVTQPMVQVTPPPQMKTIQLRGRVRDRMGKPLNDRFWVGVLAKQLGPIQNSEGSFTLEVPQSSTYDVALWNTETGTINISTGFLAEPDGAGYELQLPLLFQPPVGMASLENSRSKRVESPTQLARSQISAQ